MFRPDEKKAKKLKFAIEMLLEASAEGPVISEYQLADAVGICLVIDHELFGQPYAPSYVDLLLPDAMDESSVYGVIQSAAANQRLIGNYALESFLDDYKKSHSPGTGNHERLEELIADIKRSARLKP